MMMPLVHAACAAALLIAQSGPSQPAPAVGFVLSMRGPWQIDGRDLKRGEGVPARAHLTLAASARFDTGQDYALDLVLLNNDRVFCHSAPDCRAGVTVPAALNADASLAARMSNVFARIFEKPERWVGLVSRGTPSRLDLADAVISTDGRAVSFGNLLGAVPPGSYRLTLRPALETTPALKAFSLPVILVRNMPASVPLPVPPGLYIVTLAPDQKDAAPGREAWMLLTDPAHFAAASRDFNGLVAATSAWATDVAPADLARFRHAYLAEIAAGIR